MDVQLTLNISLGDINLRFKNKTWDFTYSNALSSRNRGLQTRSFEDVQLCYLVKSGMGALRNITKYYKVLQIITKYCNVIQRLTNTNTKDWSLQIKGWEWGILEHK